MKPVQKLYESLQNLEAQLKLIAADIFSMRKDISDINISALEKRGENIAKLFSALPQLNSAVDAAVQEISITIQNDGENRVDAIEKSLQKQDRDVLKRLRSSVKSLAASIKNELEINRALLKDSSQFAATSLNIFSNALREASHSTYGNQGRFVNSVETPHIICKEI